MFVNAIISSRLAHECLSDDPRLTLTYFTGRSFFLSNAFKWK